MCTNEELELLLCLFYTFKWTGFFSQFPALSELSLCQHKVEEESRYLASPTGVCITGGSVHIEQLIPWCTVYIANFFFLVLSCQSPKDGGWSVTLTNFEGL